MAHSYSMTNQNLQNSASERAYLKQTNQELKVERWGTTNIVYIGNEACKEIFVGVDSRATTGGEDGSIKDDDYPKFFYMESCNVFATKAGNSTHCDSMLNFVEDYFMKHKEIVNGIHMAPKVAKFYISKYWPKNRRLELFKGFTIMAGYDEDGIPHVYKVISSGKVYKKSKSNICEGYVMGTGGKYVREYFKSCNMEEAKSSNELLENIIRALLYAALFDGRSGGYLRVFKVKQRGYDLVYKKSVLEALFDHYSAVDSYMSNSLFFLFDNRNYSYTHKSNLKVHEAFQEQFKEEYMGNVVVKLGSKFVVRLVHFEKPISELYEKLRKEKKRRHNVPREVQDLPSVRIENFGRVLILCGKLSQELVKNLQDL